jgi:hypothetical protein
MNYHHFGYKQESLKKIIAQHQHVKQRIWGGVARSPPPIETKPLNHHYVSHYRPSFATIVTIIVDFCVVTPFISKLKSPPHGDVV